MLHNDVIYNFSIFIAKKLFLTITKHLIIIYKKIISINLLKYSFIVTDFFFFYKIIKILLTNEK